eukprot:366024-Chlamydomonas_euryale.AAC.23
MEQVQQVAGFPPPRSPPIRPPFHSNRLRSGCPSTQIASDQAVPPLRSPPIRLSLHSDRLRSGCPSTQVAFNYAAPPLRPHPNSLPIHSGRLRSGCSFPFQMDIHPGCLITANAPMGQLHVDKRPGQSASGARLCPLPLQGCQAYPSARAACAGAGVCRLGQGAHRSTQPLPHAQPAASAVARASRRARRGRGGASRGTA